MSIESVRLGYATPSKQAVNSGWTVVIENQMTYLLYKVRQIYNYAKLAVTSVFGIAV